MLRLSLAGSGIEVDEKGNFGLCQPFQRLHTMYQREDADSSMPQLVFLFLIYLLNLESDFLKPGNGG